MSNDAEPVIEKGMLLSIAVGDGERVVYKVTGIEADGRLGARITVMIHLDTP